MPKDFKWSCVMECAIARCMSHELIEGVTKRTQETTTCDQLSNQLSYHVEKLLPIVSMLLWYL